MKKSGRRILSIILTAVMIFALLPVIGNPMVVKAEDTPAEHVAHDEQCSAEETDCKYHKDWTKISTWTELKSLGEKGGSGYLVDNIKISNPFKIESGKTVNLCLNGYSITQTEDVYTITVNGTLNLYDKKGNLGIITHADGKNGIGVFNLGTFTMNGGTISGNNATTGGGVDNLGTFTMNGGTISGNNAAGFGGGVSNKGTFTMTEGTISGNKANWGGGVFNGNKRTFTMNGGTISGNEAKVYGGGVYNSYGTFTMNGGTISENKAKTDADDYSYGGGVFNTKTFTMNGGTISGNEAKDYGGGVYNTNEGTFTMKGGTISENKTIKEGKGYSYGGGVYNKGTFTMEGGTISKNAAILEGKGYSYGGGVYNGKTFTMKEGTISGNNATYGGGVYNNNNGTFTMTEGTIKDNTASKKGSGVYSHYSFVKEGGEIDGSIESGTGTLLTVTFNSNEEPNKTITQYVRPNEDINLEPNKFSYGNYPFGCWNTKEDGTGDSYEDNATINIKGDLVLFARWIEKSYEVTFNVNNGSWEDGTKDEKAITVFKYVGDKELKLNASNIPTPSNPDTGYKGSWDNVSDMVNELTENKTYTYTFAPIEYTIKYDSNGGVGTMLDQDRKYDDKAPLTANSFTYEGKTFNGWNTEADGSGKDNYSDGEIANISNKDNDTVTLYAQWTIGTFTISWKNYDGTVLETDKNVAYGSTPAYDGETPVRAKEGNKVYTFSGWTPEIDTVKGAATYTATYSEEVVEQTEPETPQNPTEPETPEEPEEEIPEKDWLDDLRLALRIADELGGPQTVEYSGDFALSYDIMEYLKEHTDITLVYHVTYEGATYTVTIPAGRAIADANIGWYGPLWLLANYGGDNVPEIIAGSGKYTVVAGDTLSAIAEKFGTTVDYLAQKNGIKNPDYIIVGQVIVY